MSADHTENKKKEEKLKRKYENQELVGEKNASLKPSWVEISCWLCINAELK